MHVLLVWIVYATGVLYCTQISVAQLDDNGKLVPCTKIIDCQCMDYVCVQSNEAYTI